MRNIPWHMLTWGDIALMALVIGGAGYAVYSVAEAFDPIPYTPPVVACDVSNGYDDVHCEVEP